LTVLYQNVRRSVPYILNYIWQRWGKQKMVAVRSTNETTLIFWVFYSLSTCPRGRWTPKSQKEKGHIGRHRPYTNEIWCGSVHALLRYSSKTPKMQKKFPIDSYSNENFISPFFRPPGAAKPQNGRRHPEPVYARMQTLAWIGPRVVEKSLTEQKKIQ